MLLLLASCGKEKLIENAGKYKIPKNLEEAILYLKSNLDDKKIDFLKGGKKYSKHEAQELDYYFKVTLPFYIRSAWELNTKNTLRIWFLKKGISHPDDISDVIVKALYLDLKGQKIDLKEKAKEIDRSWKMKKKPKPFLSKTSNTYIIPIGKYLLDVERKAVIHLGVDEKNGEAWFYELDKKWYKPNRETLLKFQIKEKLSEDENYKDIVVLEKQKFQKK